MKSIQFLMCLLVCFFFVGININNAKGEKSKEVDACLVENFELVRLGATSNSPTPPTSSIMFNIGGIRFGSSVARGVMSGFDKIYDWFVVRCGQGYSLAPTNDMEMGNVGNGNNASVTRSESASAASSITGWIKNLFAKFGAIIIAAVIIVGSIAALVASIIKKREMEHKMEEEKKKGILLVKVNGVVMQTINSSDPIPEITTTMGDSVTFEIQAQPGDRTLKPEILGIPHTWIARFGGEVLYYCSSSVTPNEFRPWLGFNSQVHGTVIRKYPVNHQLKENDWTRKEVSEILQWTWSCIMKRRMDAEKSSISPAHVWQKQKQNPHQRNNQQEGLNMELLHSWSDWKNAKFHTYEGEDYVMGFDPDEILYMGSQRADTRRYHPSTGLYKIDQGNEPWKQVPVGESEPVNDVVTAYQINREYVINKNDSYVKKYEGYEIQDIGTDKLHPDGTATGNVEAPGIVTINYNGVSFKVKFNVNAPLTIDKGFYGHIKGPQWPAIGEKNVQYTLTDLPNDKAEIEKYSMKYDWEDNLGILQSTIISARDLPESEKDRIASDGKWGVYFDIKEWGYHSVTAEYQRTNNSKPVMIAGKELLEVSLRFINIDLPGSYTENKDGAYIYLEEFRDKKIENLAAIERYGRYIDKYNREYTFKSGDKVKINIYDSDPHTFAPHTSDRNPEWYLSERTQAKRIPADSLQKNLEVSIAKLNTQAKTISTKTRIGSGQTLDHTWGDYTGSYELEAEYRKTSKVYHLVVIEDYPETSGIKGENNLPTLGAVTGTGTALASAREIIRDVDLSQERFSVLNIKNVYSKYMYKDAERANETPHINRFGRFHDYSNNYVWYVKHPETGTWISLINPEKVKTWIDNYYTTENYASWFPTTWLRHYSDKTNLPKDVDSDDMKTLAESKPYIENLFSEIPEPWQARLPWISETDYDGSRIRTNIKVIYKMDKFWDNTHGAFSGNPNVPESKSEYKKSTFLNLMSDEIKDKKRAYNDLRFGRKLVFDKLMFGQTAQRQARVAVFHKGPGGAEKFVSSGYIFLKRPSVDGTINRPAIPATNTEAINRPAIPATNTEAINRPAIPATNRPAIPATNTEAINRPARNSFFDKRYPSKNKIRVYPNPVTNDRLRVHVISSEITHIELRDFYGRLIYTASVTSGRVHEITGLRGMGATNIFFVRCLNDKERVVSSKQVVISR